MKIQLSFDVFKNFCLAMSDDIKNFDPDEIVAVVRGGLSISHIIGKVLNKKIGMYFPLTGELHLNNKSSEKIVFIEDLIAKGRTLTELGLRINQLKKYNWKFAPFLIDENFNIDESLYKNQILTYALKTPHWIVMPYENLDMMKENDRGLFRNNTDSYGK